MWLSLASAAPAADFHQDTGRHRSRHHNHINSLADLPILRNSGNSYGAPAAPVVASDSYGAPAAPVIGYDSYGAPAAPPVSDGYGAPASPAYAPVSAYEEPAPAYDDPLADLPLDPANEPFRDFSNFLQPNHEGYGTNIDTARASGQRPPSAQHLTPPRPGRPPRRQLRPRIDKKPKGILEEMNSTLQKLGRQAHSWNVSMLNKISNLFL